MASPRLFASMRTMSAMLFALFSVADIFLPVVIFLFCRRPGLVPRLRTGRGPYAVHHRCSTLALRNNAHSRLWVPAPRAQSRTRPGRLLAPCRAVLLVLRGDRVARLFPVGVRPFAHLVEIAAGGERLRAVHGDGLAGDPV